MKKISIDETWLKEQYLDKERSARDISNEVGCSNVTVLRKLRSIGIKIRMPQEETLIKTNNYASKFYRDREWLYDQYVIKRRHLKDISRELDCDDSILSDWLKQFGISIREQIGENCHNWKGGNKHIPYYENKECPNYLGRYIAEGILSKYFKGVKRMPYGNIGYDFICKKGYMIDVKSSCLRINGRYTNPKWSFDINHNKIADYFLCIGFDNRKDLNPIQLWLIPGKLVNRKHALIITNSEKSMNRWEEYEKPIEKVTLCCEKLKKK